MLTKALIRKLLFSAFLCGSLTLAACSTQGASRYGDTPNQAGAVPCGPTVTPCRPIIRYQAVIPPPYTALRPCQGVQCAPPISVPAYSPDPIMTNKAPVVEPPVMSEPPAYEFSDYEPPISLPPTRVLRPVIDEPVDMSCPEGSILGYGGQGCIPISISRK